MVVLSGFGIRVTVERGHLCLEDGVGGSRRHARLARATSGLKRAAFIAVDTDAELISAAGPFGLDDARLRRAQALAMSNGVGLTLARELIKKKLKGQMEVLEWFKDSISARVAVKLASAKLARATSIEELRFFESEAARAYWRAWENLPVRFSQRDSARIPEHWLSFGNRSSLISKPSPRRATNPANALLNYVYAILEAETRIALIRVGLDPAIGIMHFDLRARDSLACDLMEAIRPQADEYVFELVQSREFRQKDFF
jgi:CRISPR-associated endonuclease Cas1